MNEVLPSDSQNWDFPDLDILDSSGDQINVSLTSDIEDNNSENNEENNKFDQEDDNLSPDTLNNEIQEIKNKYEKKFELMKKLVNDLEKPLSFLDNEFIELIQYIIKKSVKHIIYKEIKSDSKIITKIIDELTSLIDAKNGIITVSLSEADYGRIEDKENTPSRIFKLNPSLAEGDILVDSNFTQIRAILNDRINQLLGIKYA